MRRLTKTCLAACVSLLSLPAAQAAELVFHEGFETCWVDALTPAQFLNSIRTSIEGTTSCVPAQSGSQSGVNYTVCAIANGCGAGVNGCQVTLHAGAFSGDFQAGQFTGPGSANNLSVPLTTSISAPCTVQVNDIVLGYTLDYLMRVDGVDGVYSDDMLTPMVDISSYTTSNNCDAFLAGLIASYVPQIIAEAETNAAAAIEPGLREDTLEQSVCPLPPP